MSNLAELVPPLDLCKLIPEGEFADTAFVRIGNTKIIALRRSAKWSFPNQPHIPAPTLKEIMSELSLCDERGDTGWFCMAGDPDHWSIGNCECDLYVKNGTENKSPEAAALKLWLNLKGIEYEQKQS